VRTGQSQQEALILFDKIIQSKDPAVAPLAMLEKGQLLIDMNRLQEASSFLKKWLESLKSSDPLHLPAGLLLGGAIYAQGTANPDSLTDALAVYDKLLPQTNEDAALFNRIQYLRGKTLEQIADAKDPARKREKEAFIAYYSVLEKSDTPAEWHYFELCGFRAVALLEKAGRWPAAIACAKKIASFKGPRAEEAAAHASQLQLKHMIWED
jgi:tetratricopeptide (TPR) repeat protein